MYTPILRNRQGEVLALKALSRDIKVLTLPLIDLAAPTKKADEANRENYVRRNINRLPKAVSGFGSVLLDSSELDPDFRIGGKVHPLSFTSKAILDAEVIPIPVTGLHRDTTHHRAALKIKHAVDDGAICFRLDATDIDTATVSLKQLLAIMKADALDPAEVILVLDMQSVYRADVASLAGRVARFLEQASRFAWRGIIVAGYGLPDQLAEAVAVREQGYIPRLELAVYTKLVGVQSGRDIWFGDYTTLTPTHVELDWRIISKTMSPKIIYTLPDSWFVVRGGPFSNHPDGYDQYYDLAAEVVALDEFPDPPNFSFGDQYIYDCAMRTGSTGNPASWITACVNRHITITASIHDLL